MSPLYTGLYHSLQVTLGKSIDFPWYSGFFKQYSWFPLLIVILVKYEGPLWSWSYGSWMYKYICN